MIKQVKEFITFIIHLLSDGACLSAQHITQIDRMDGSTRFLVQLYKEEKFVFSVLSVIVYVPLVIIRLLNFCKF